VPLAGGDVNFNALVHTAAGAHHAQETAPQRRLREAESALRSLGPGEHTTDDIHMRVPHMTAPQVRDALRNNIRVLATGTTSARTWALRPQGTGSESHA
jgi:hypothetical protein